MKTYRHFIQEMAAPRPSDLQKKYYHGTQSLEAAISIYKDGLNPAAIETKHGARKSMLRPMDGHVYITPHLSYAGIYAIGGDLYGSDAKNHFKRDYGYIFEISGKNLADIGPDEDSIGEFIYEFHRKGAPSGLEDFMRLAKDVLTPNQWRKVLDGEYSYWAQVGKKLTKIMPDWMKLALIDQGAHIAHKGRLRISKAYRLDLEHVKHMKRDGSDLKKYLEPWKP